MRLGTTSISLFILSLTALTASGCGDLVLPVFPEYGKECPNARYYIDSSGLRVDAETGDGTDKHDGTHPITANSQCPQNMFCFIDTKGSYFCADSCPQGQHLYSENSLKYCVDDSNPRHCGETNIDCLDQTIHPGWAQAKCINADVKPECILVSCLDGWRTDPTVPNACVNAQTCCGAFCSSCESDEQKSVCYSPIQDFENDINASCEKSCNKSALPLSENDMRDLIECSGTCVDRTGNDYCGSDSACIPSPCIAPKTCRSTGKLVFDTNASTPIERFEYKCLCPHEAGEEAVTFCSDVKKCQSLIDPANCGKCGNNCKTQNDTWESAECTKINADMALSCFGDDCDLTSAVACSPTKCISGYSLVTNKDTSIAECVLDTASTCGSQRLNCKTEHPNAIDVACESGECAAKTCTAGYTLNNKRCIPVTFPRDECTNDADCSTGKKCCGSYGSRKCQTVSASMDCSIDSTMMEHAAMDTDMTITDMTINEALVRKCTSDSDCLNGQSCCSNTCVSLTGSANCGACGSVCNTSKVSHSTAVSCTDGTCKPTECDNSYSLNASGTACIKILQPILIEECTKDADCASGKICCGIIGKRKCQTAADSASCIRDQAIIDEEQAIMDTDMTINEDTDMTINEALMRKCTSDSDCLNGQSCCSNTCVSLTGSANCGACGSVCNTSKVSHSTAVSCSTGTCKPTACEDPYTLNTDGTACI